MTPERPARSPADLDELHPTVLLTGRTVGDFLIGERLGGGGFGVIYHARQLTLGREVVIKVLRQQSASDDSRAQRFLREAKLASRLDHPYAAHIYAFGIEADGLFWIAMELVRGIALKEFLVTRGRFTLARFVPFLERICEVVYTAHEQSIIHRDIKPSNVMVLSRAGRLLPKLLDLGVARLLSDDVPALEIEDTSESAIDIRAMSEAIAGVDSGPTTVTLGERALGSPPYMAPEQWGRAFAADARADQYSLAVLAYEAITGHRPFQADDTADLAAEHLRGRVPLLGSKYPTALNDVFARALAKKPNDRYADVLEFARAFRSASGLERDDEESIPRLDSTLRETLLARAPQPLADCIALLDSGYDPRRAALAATQTTRVLVRLLGIMAVAGFTRVGLGENVDLAPIRAALRHLRQESLSLADWLATARALVQPFANRPDTHPVPELVLALTESRSVPGSGAPSDASDDASDDASGDASTADVGVPELGQLLVLERDFSGPESLSALQACLPVLEQILRRLSFLCEYRMVARHRERDEVRMGARRSARPTLIVRGEEQEREEGEITLVGADGAPLLRLSPWCRLLAPAPGALEEIFLFDGKSRLGARLRAFPIGFEWHDPDFWPWYQSQLQDIDPQLDDPDDQIESARRSPYLGLIAFAPADKDNYFGREREVGQCVNRLLVLPFLAVVGPSGAGKSSFVQAGIVPSLPSSWRTLVVRPGHSPLMTLCTRLCQEWLDHAHSKLTRDELYDRVKTDPAELGRILRAHAEAGDNKLVIIVDQFEELVTLGADEDARRMYAQALVSAAYEHSDSVRLILTVRDDFLLRVQSLAPLRGRFTESLQLLATPPADELERILLEPARRFGYQFEDPSLPREMVEAIADEPGALALLSFTAAKLWELRDTEARQLTRSAYRELGGVGGALAQHAEETLKRMSHGHREVVREAFRHLVTAQGTRAVLTRTELSQLLSRQRDADAVIEALISARLLVASEGASGQDRVEVAHEALLSSWPRLVRWQRLDAESARLRDQLRAAARQWIARGRPKGLLWRGDALLEYRLWRTRYDGALTDDEQQFARMSVADEERGARRRKVISIGAFAMLVIGMLFMWYLQRRADDARQRAYQERTRAQEYAQVARQSAEQARARLLDLYVEQGRQALLDGDGLRALAYLSEARSEGADGTDVTFLLARTRDALADQRLVIDAGSATIWAIAFSPDGSTIASGNSDGRLQLWNTSDGRLVRDFVGHKKSVWTLAFSEDGSKLLSGSWDGRARLWRVETGEEIWTATHRGPIRWTAFARNDTRVVTSSADRAVTVRAVDTGDTLIELKAAAPVVSGAVSADGRLLAVGGAAGQVQIYQLADGRPIAGIPGHETAVMDLAFDPDSSVLAGGAMAGTLRVSPVAAGAKTDRPGGPEEEPLAGHRSMINRVRFDPTGRHLLTTSEDETAVVWSAETGRIASELTGHQGGVTDGLFGPDGDRIVTASRDGQAIAWDARKGTRLWTFIGHRNGIWRVALDSAGKQLATAGLDGEIRLWNADHSAYSFAVAGLPTAVMDAEFGPDGRRVALVRAGRDGSGIVLEIIEVNPAPDSQPDSPRSDPDSRALHTWQHAMTVPEMRSARLAWSRDGGRIALSGDASVKVLQVADSLELIADLAHPQLVRDVIFGADADTVFSVSDDDLARRWSLATGREVRQLAGHESDVVSVDIDHTGRYLLTASNDHSARIWDVDSGDELEQLSLGDKRATSARFSADGTLVIATSVDQSARILSTRGDPKITLDGHTAAVISAVLSPDGKLAATGSRDGTIKVWNPLTGGMLWSSPKRPGGVTGLSFDATGQRLLAVQGTGVTVWASDYDLRSADEIVAVTRCRSGYHLRDARLEYDRPNHDECNRSVGSHTVQSQQPPR